MEIIQHLLGICPDSYSHPDLLGVIANYIPFQDIFHLIISNIRIAINKLFTRLN